MDQEEPNKLLKKALKANNSESVLEALETGADLYNNVLIWAAGQGNKEAINFVLNKVENYDHIKLDYIQAACFAAKYGKTEVIQWMINIINDKEKIIKKTGRILKYAVRGGQIETFIELESLMGKYNMNIEYEHMLDNAARSGNLKIFNHFLNKTYERRNRLQNLLDEAERNGKKERLEMISILIKSGINYQYLLEMSVFSGNTDLVLLILKLMNENGHTPNYRPLMLTASNCGTLEMILLIKDLMEKNGKEPDDQILLYGMVRVGDKTNVEKFLRIIVQKDTRLIDAILVEAIERGNKEIIEMILMYTRSYRMPLITAIKKGNFELMMKLMEQIKNPDYLWMMDIAISKGHSEIVEYLINEMRQDNQYVNYNRLLYSAVKSKNLNLFKMVLSLGRNTFRLGDFTDALSSAASRGYFKMVKIILGYFMRPLNDSIIECFNDSILEAARKGYILTVELLLNKMREEGINPPKEKLLGISTLHPTTHQFLKENFI